jgi:hypothetical protein
MDFSSGTSNIRLGLNACLRQLLLTRVVSNEKEAYKQGRSLLESETSAAHEY